jgi:biotin carboxylase
MSRRVLLLMPTTSYKATDFMEAASRLGVEVVIGTERKQALQDEAPGTTLVVDLDDQERGARSIRGLAAERPLNAVIGVDDETVELATRAAEVLGLPHNPLDAVRASRDKHATRQRLAEAGLRTPRFRLVPTDADPRETAREVGFPCVLKPRFLAASRGVLRADDGTGFVAAFERIRSLLQDPEVRKRGGDRAGEILVEDYIPGDEVAVEGLLEEGALRVLALFDKPDPLVGPTFEETLFVTPSRHPAEVQRAIAREAEAACRALGLYDGPVHAELRVRDGEPWMLEVAARTIGGLCARALRFGAGVSLEELVLRHALGLGTGDLAREDGASGVLMIPTPQAGVLQKVRGLEDAAAVPGVVDLALSVHRGTRIEPLPEGHRYLGFIFARGGTPELAEQALRDAHAALGIEIAPA